MNKEKIIQLLIQKKTGAITLADRIALDEWLEKDRDGAAMSQMMDELYEIRFAPDIPSVETALKESNEKLNYAIEREGSRERDQQGFYFLRRRRVAIIVSVAALLLVIVGISWFLFIGHSSLYSTDNIVEVKRGAKTNLVLPDGSKVWLNADSRITYGSDFGKTTRNVRLSGEAYFDVVKDSNRPFVVQTDALDVRVLGTVFNVRAYSDENSTQAVLLRGSIEIVFKRNNKERIFLKPNEKVIVRNDYSKETAISKQTVNIPKITIVNVLPDKIDSTTPETQWLKNRLLFDQDRLADIVPVLEKWYGVTIEVKDSSLLQRRLSGRFENEGLKEVLESFKLAMKFQYRIDNNVVSLYN